MKNPIQLLSLIYIKNQEIRNLIESQFENEGGRYIRYYPSNTEFEKNIGDYDKINSWLKSEGYVIKNENDYLYIMFDFS